MTLGALGPVLRSIFSGEVLAPLEVAEWFAETRRRMLWPADLEVGRDAGAVAGSAGLRFF